MLRRRILKMLCAAPLSSLLSTLGPIDSSLNEVDQERLLERIEATLLSVFEDRRAAAQIGEQYIEQLSRPFSSSSVVSRFVPFSSFGTRSVLEALLQMIDQDFEEDRTVVLEGWVLSLTEAEICALASSARV